MLNATVSIDPLAKARVSIHPMGTCRAEIRIAGDLPVVWPERFASALAPKSIRILRGEAEHRAEDWTGHFELESLQPKDDPNDLDYTAIFREIPAARQARPVAALHYGLVRLANVLRLAVQAEDRNGLLADVLVKLKHLGLYPKRLTIDTASGLVTQCFWLTGYGGRDPDVQTERVLREFLNSSRKLRRT